MCTAYAGMAMQLVGGLGSAYGARAEHNANAAYLDSQANLTQIQANNAINSIMYSGGMQASQARMEGLSTMKSQRAAMASHGLASNSFTYQNLLDDSIYNSERDAAAIQYNADVQAHNVRTDAMLKTMQYKQQAGAERMAGKMAFQSGLLSTGSQFLNSWLSYSGTSMGRTAGAQQGEARSGYLGRDTNYYTGNNLIDWDKNRFSWRDRTGWGTVPQFSRRWV